MPILFSRGMPPCPTESHQPGRVGEVVLAHVIIRPGDDKRAALRLAAERQAFLSLAKGPQHHGVCIGYWQRGRQAYPLIRWPRG